MKIRFIETIATEREAYRRGHEYDLPNDQANHYVQSGIAVKSTEPGGALQPMAPKAVDPAAQAAAKAFEEGRTASTNLSSGNPPPETTTAVPPPTVAPVNHPPVEPARVDTAVTEPHAQPFGSNVPGEAARHGKGTRGK